MALSVFSVVLFASVPLVSLVAYDEKGQEVLRCVSGNCKWRGQAASVVLEDSTGDERFVALSVGSGAPVVLGLVRNQHGLWIQRVCSFSMPRWASAVGFSETESPRPQYYDECLQRVVDARLDADTYGAPSSFRWHDSGLRDSTGRVVEALGTGNAKRDRECPQISMGTTLSTERGEFVLGFSRCLKASQPWSRVPLEVMIPKVGSPAVRCIAEMPSDGSRWVDGLAVKPSGYEPSTKTVTFVDPCRSGLSFRTDIAFRVDGPRLRFVSETEVGVEPPKVPR
jgi:hypothetical protein